MERCGLVTRCRGGEDEHRATFAPHPHTAALHEQAQWIPETLAPRIDFDATRRGCFRT